MRLKPIAFLLIICLALGAAAPALSAGNEGLRGNYFPLEERSSPVAFTTVGDDLYILDQEGGLYRVSLTTGAREKVGDCFFTGYFPKTDDSDWVEQELAQARERGLTPVARLFSMEGRLYGFCPYTEKYGRLLDDAGVFAPAMEAVELNTDDFYYHEDEYDYPVDLASLFALEGKLYYTGMVHTMRGIESRAGVLDLITGEGRSFGNPDLAQLMPWKGGQLMARIFNEASRYTPTMERETPMEYGLFDPQTGAVTPLGVLRSRQPDGNVDMLGAMCADPEQDMLYYMDAGRVMGLNVTTGESLINAYTGEGAYGGSNYAAVLYAGGYYIRQTYDMVDWYKMDAESMKNGALRIFGEYGSDAHRKFARSHPEIPVETGDAYFNSMESLTAAMVSGSDTYDVLILDMSYMPVDQLMAKGYCMDLSRFPEIEATVAQMYPKFVDPMRQDGKLFGVPVDLRADAWGVSKDIWESRMGLTSADYPQTFEELLTFISRWEDDFAGDYGDISLMNGTPFRELLFGTLLQNYMAYTQYKQEPLRFDTPLMRRLLDAYEAIDFSGFPDSDQSGWMGEYLFDAFMSVSNLSMASSNDYDTLLLPLAEGEDVALGADLQVMIINPRTTRAEQAAAYVHFILNNFNPAEGNISLFPNHNEPVENSYYRRDLETVTEQLEKDRALLETAEEGNRPRIQSQIDMAEEYLVSMEQWRYLVSEEAIENYRQNIYPNIFVKPPNILARSDASDISRLLEQYMDGAVGRDQVLAEMDKRVRMMEMEAQ